MEIGYRVVRGPDWQWGNQNSGEGCLGTVVQGDGETIEGTVWVQWDGGRLANYRAGFDGKMDLRVYDSAGKGIVHHHVQCNGCNQLPVMGMRWKCLNCHNYDLCTSCYMADTHDLDCEFTRIDESRGQGTPVGKREEAPKIPASGMFCGARVTRGPDWRWGEQDGGKGEQGTVIAMKEWKQKAKKNVGASVRWDRTKKDNIYRYGAEGKIDLTVVTPESGGFFYKDHLPGLIARCKKTVKGFTTGDKVYVKVSKEELVKMAEGHGGWNANMEECLTKVGVVHDFTTSGDVIVNYNGVKWRLTPSAITKIHKYKVGDKVLVSSDRKRVMQMQEGHGGWNDKMKTILGMIGAVKAVHEDEDVVLSVDNNLWVVNPGILTLHEAAKEKDDDDDDDSDLSDPFSSVMKEQLDLQKLISKMFMPDSDSDNDKDKSKDGKELVKAASNGHLSTVKRILNAHPELVNYKVMGKTGLHLACHSGYCDIIKFFLATPACDTKVKDSQGYVAIHHAAYGDKSGEALKVMLSHGEDPNVANNENKSAPLHLAVKENNVNAVRILVQTDDCDVNLQDAAGDTPLHDAILLGSNVMVNLILEAPRLNLTIKNEAGFNCFHLSAFKGNSHSIRKLIAMCPEMLDVPKEDGFTCLHLAAINDHCEIAEALLEHPECKVDSLNKVFQTPLMVAVHEGYLSMVQILEQKGANVNATDEDGDTPLHISIMREKLISSGMGMMLSLLGKSSGSFIEISRYLISHGADIRKRNNMGQSPMNLAIGSKIEEELKEVFEKTRPEENMDKSNTKIVNEFGSTGQDAQLESCKDDDAQNTSELDNKLVNNIILGSESSSNTLQNQSHEFQNDGGNATARAMDIEMNSELENQCIICVDEAAEVVFEPCGHCIVCKECAVRARRCPECKIKVVTKKTKDGTEILNEKRATTEQQLQAMEKKYRKLEESVTCCVCMSRRMNMVFPCGHGACQVCTAKLTVCAICKKDIERKIAMF